MAERSLLADFLRVRRESLQPEQVGLVRDGNRRVRGLRREEIARLADISADYYLRLEQGRNHQPSEQVLAALSRALRLDEDERAYFHRVARAQSGPAVVEALPPRVTEASDRVLEQWVHTPAYITDRHHDLLALNGPAALMTPGLKVGTNLMLDVFAHEHSAASPEDWAVTAQRMVSALRFHAAPGHPRLTELVGRLSVESRAFRRMWTKHDVRPLSSSISVVPVEPFGLVEFRSQTLEIVGEGGQFITTYFADPGSRSASAIRHLVAGVPSRDTQFVVPRSDSDDRTASAS
jgi:transcriptional regulator with XRE-family HTH domain